MDEDIPHLSLKIAIFHSPGLDYVRLCRSEGHLSVARSTVVFFITGRTTSGAETRIVDDRFPNDETYSIEPLFFHGTEHGQVTLNMGSFLDDY